jgi:hypothetical protein
VGRAPLESTAAAIAAVAAVAAIAAVAPATGPGTRSHGTGPSLDAVAGGSLRAADGDVRELTKRVL